METAFDFAPGPKAQLQRDSLDTVFVSDGDQPPSPSEAERAEFPARLVSAPESDYEELAAFIQDPDLQLLATRDSDGDGVHDYRISDYFGKFLEGDVDLDGDGIRNSLDEAPYDSGTGGTDTSGDGAPDRGFADQDADKIPDHVDWSGLTSDDAAGWQRELFRRHDLLLVERSAPFSPTFARSTWDAVTRVFRRPLEDGNLPTLRLIATDETCLLSAEVDDETNAMTIPQTQSLLVYRIGLDYPPIAQLGLMVHELAHVWQFALDFDETDLVAENKRVYYPAPSFLALVEPYGWSSEPLDYDPEVDDYVLFTPQYYGVEPLYRYRGESTEEWEGYLAELDDELGEAYLEDPSLAGIVGDYSLTSPWEWHADNLMAWVYTSIEARVRQTLGREESEAMLATLREVVRHAWPGFRYQNFDRALLEDHYNYYFPLKNSDLDYFVENYLRPAVVHR